ncbi:MULTISPECIES: SDR family NAD(P)-dependent oxidoreductase [Vibrio oreintalis group]|uniref:SDR family oxidoreductase n=1 Tax=Vibrio europaeus TaxID=300876 RepID=A0A178J534_9VIBR|nr:MULTISPECIES: SDR family NAD(P)-dependent oxidoreductase [Vibrio oreintalis group]MCG9583677.1 SDR family oxidoreductase [Vibrio tubiashii]MCG9617255.1 SDR family oxidoreductase [Vibrio tubiashii]MCG9689481.1 SDR family oxidoreductase [Vibrio tubiashii]MDC5706620.1 SDR family NAD(P)-dependent oxidoreductase [Vibrio europaeus]MDC5711847.1 SDR family oxidoreductase [Vibrio europaeus]
MKTVLITGAAKGIGQALSRYFVGQGYNVIMVDIDQLALDNQAIDSDLTSMHVTDVACEESVADLFAKVQREYRRVDILINNAGISPKTEEGSRLSMEDISSSDWDKVMATNTKSVFLMCKYFSRLMASGSKIINIASMMGSTGSGTDNPNIFPYSVSGLHYSCSKAGVINLTKSIARELAVKGILVNAVSPGAVSGGMGHFKSSFIDTIESAIPLNEICGQHDIVHGVRFLASDSNTALTGQNININGGWLM